MYTTEVPHDDGQASFQTRTPPGTVPTPNTTSPKMDHAPKTPELKLQTLSRKHRSKSL